MNKKTIITTLLALFTLSTSATVPDCILWNLDQLNNTILWESYERPVHIDYTKMIQ